MKILLIGGHGYLGEHIYFELYLAGHTIYSPTSNECNVKSEVSINGYINRLPDLDMLIYAAAKKSQADCLGSLEDFSCLLDVNLLGAVRCCRAVVPKMNNGKIVIIGSVDGTFGNPNNGMYSVSKSALHQYSRCLSALLKGKIAVNCVVPGTLRTKDDAVAVAKLVAFLSTTNGINGSMLRVDNGHHTFAI